MAMTTHNRRNSRSNSISSVLTVKNPASVSSKAAPRNSILRRPASPDETQQNHDRFAPKNGSKTQPDSSTECKSAHPNININRWSHSTSSSTSAIDTEATRKRAQQTGRRVSVGPGFSGNGNKTATPARNKSQQRSPSKSPMRQQNPNTRVLGGPDQGEPLPDVSASAATLGLTPKSMYNTATADYFGETWQQRKQAGKLGDPVTAMSIHYMTTAGQKPRKIDDVSQPKSAPLADSGSTSEKQLDKPVKASNGVTADNAGESQMSEQRRSRGHRSPTQKNMLSKALAKANTAVLLDNAQNIDGAIEAYAEACDLLQQVMARSWDVDDRKKLSAIRSTYSNRIAELHDLDDSFIGLMDKELPDDPPSDSGSAAFFHPDHELEPTTAEVLEQVHIPPRQESLLPHIYGGEVSHGDATAPPQRKPIQNTTLRAPVESQYMPPPLSPRRPPSPSTSDTSTPHATQPPAEISTTSQHTREGSNESTSWLDTVDDAESSASSSGLSSFDFDAGDSQNLADEIEAEFDAALNAAVDAAYDGNENEGTTGLLVTPRQRRESRRKSSAAIPTRAPVPSSVDVPSQPTQAPLVSGNRYSDYLDEDTTEEEERLLDEMTQGYVFNDFHFDDKSKSALPRQSDSSNVSNRTYGSSAASTTAANGPTLRRLAESNEPPVLPTLISQPATVNDTYRPPAPLTEPPKVPEATATTTAAPRPQSIERQGGIGLRDRRLSGQSARQLKIETFSRNPVPSQSNAKNVPALPTIEIPVTSLQQRIPQSAPLPPLSGLSSMSNHGSQPITPMTSVHSNDSMNSESPATPGLTQGGSQGSAEDAQIPKSPTRLGQMMPPPQPGMRKNLSSSSLRMRNLSVNVNDDSPVTPGSAVFLPDGRKAAPPMPTPADSKFNVQSFQAGGMYLFDDHTGNADSPNTPKTPHAFTGYGAPSPLEPCPESFLLRPFWLMRCLYQTIAHPRGGYISTKLFIPRDIWRVKNVKLKFVDDKISQCDLLTAALLKLSKVDNLDADAVLDELTSFEMVLEQVRGGLQKKLGSEVGLSSSTNVFKSPSEEAVDPMAAKSGNSAAKSFASGWRKLRSKSSTATMSNSHVGQFARDPSASHAHSGLSMSSLPMTTSTSVPTSRSYYNRARAQPPTPTQLPNIPIAHAQYMASLARLFDAVQVLDSIARQVEDPGLKFSSKTHVGLELCVRGAAEFFAFYVIRFVMADLTLLVDKFLKRGTEWVLA